MSYTLIFTEQYNRRALRFIKRHPELKKPYLKTLQLLEVNPFHPSLRLHALQGKLAHCHSVSINLSYRIPWSCKSVQRKLFCLMWAIMMRFIDRNNVFLGLFLDLTQPPLPKRRVWPALFLAVVVA
ncbi:type II toxin-antitoxin system RelE/ParE family toxin [Methylovulum psychrotolerans]|uniref:Uncharacterized protein n=1 Tax=Methylovulum psychrotolerans TaxID=1704499 RepID=A0A2S5CI06_9GAMM|nr:hypothetical protein [Methylovulum psychrotolerans]POZ50434.1 hypothetical protein AADEFJLK_03847 [Methylovulum psychrotolerans]